MRFAVDVPNFGDFADPRVVADLARRARRRWDGLFVWDHVTRKELRRAIADPWVLLTAAALATRTIRLGTMVTPVARRGYRTGQGGDTWTAHRRPDDPGGRPGLADRG